MEKSLSQLNVHFIKSIFIEILMENPRLVLVYAEVRATI